MQTTSITSEDFGPAKQAMLVQRKQTFRKEKRRDDLTPIYQHFFEYIESKSDCVLSKTEKESIMNAFQVKKLRRRQYLLQEGDICTHFSYVVKGAVRMFSVNERGKEAIVDFGLEGDWVADQESLELSRESFYNIEALEDTLLLVSCKSDFQGLLNQVPAVQVMINQCNRNQAIAIQRRIHTTISMSAEEKYLELLQKHPEYVQRFSLNMIASYLGIKAETLSRVRSR